MSGWSFSNQWMSCCWSLIDFLWWYTPLWYFDKKDFFMKNNTVSNISLGMFSKVASFWNWTILSIERKFWHPKLFFRFTTKFWCLFIHSSKWQFIIILILNTYPFKNGRLFLGRMKKFILIFSVGITRRFNWKRRLINSFSIKRTWNIWFWCAMRSMTNATFRNIELVRV